MALDKPGAGMPGQMEEPGDGLGFEALIESWDGLLAVVSRHRESGSWIFVAMHDATLGRPTGGCRLKTYPTPAAGLLDAMRLAEGMSYKWATNALPYGGGKSVLAVPAALSGEERRSLFRRLGEILNALNGGYSVGQDLGTTMDDMDFLATVTPHVAGARGGGLSLDPAPYTAAGVHAGIRAAVEHLTGSPNLAGATVLVEGVGAVGSRLTRLLRESGASVLVSDVDPGRAADIARECGARVIDPRDTGVTECDVYAPCAVGATVNRRSIPKLGCRAIAGAANNQLESPTDAARLADSGILYAPDYVINGGGATAFGLMDQGITDQDELMRRVSLIHDRLGEIFTEADRDGISPATAANRRARALLGRRPR